MLIENIDKIAKGVVLAADWDSLFKEVRTNTKNENRFHFAAGLCVCGCQQKRMPMHIMAATCFKKSGGYLR